MVPADLCPLISEYEALRLGNACKLVMTDIASLPAWRRLVTRTRNHKPCLVSTKLRRYSLELSLYRRLVAAETSPRNQMLSFMSTPQGFTVSGGCNNFQDHVTINCERLQAVRAPQVHELSQWSAAVYGDSRCTSLILGRGICHCLGRAGSNEAQSVRQVLRFPV